MSAYQQAQRAVEPYTGDTSRIDRVAIKRNGEIQFCVSPTTWWGWRDGKVMHHYALNDTRIPLSQWARERGFGPAAVLAYRPGRRLVLLDRGARQIIKGYRAGHMKHAGACHELASSAAVESVLQVPRLLRDLPALDALAFEYLSAQPLRLACAGLDCRQFLVNGLLAWQRRGQTVLSSSRATALPLKSWQASMEILVLSDWLGKFKIAELSLPEGWLSVFEKISEAQPGNVEARLLHRDLHDGQVMFAGSVPIVLDFDQLALGDPAVDLGNLIAHDKLRAMQYPRLARRNTPGAVTDAFWTRVSRSAGYSASRVQWFTAASLLRLALVYGARPRWRSIAATLVAASQAAAQAALKQPEPALAGGAL